MAKKNKRSKEEVFSRLCIFDPAENCWYGYKLMLDRIKEKIMAKLIDDIMNYEEGSYGRTANYLFEKGILDREGNIPIDVTKTRKNLSIPEYKTGKQVNWNE